MLIILLVYFIAFILWLIASTVAIYQSNKYYEPGSRMKLGLNVYVGVSIFILVISFYFLLKVNWLAPLSFKL